MTLPADGPATLEGVCAELSLVSVPADPSLRRTQLVEVVAAVNSMVRAMPVAQLADADPAHPDWTGYEQVTLGANRLAARLDQRRNTPLGYEAFGEGGPVYVSRNDPDIAQLLQLGRYAPPRVG